MERQVAAAASQADERLDRTEKSLQSAVAISLKSPLQLRWNSWRALPQIRDGACPPHGEPYGPVAVQSLLHGDRVSAPVQQVGCALPPRLVREPPTAPVTPQVCESASALASCG